MAFLLPSHLFGIFFSGPIVHFIFTLKYYEIKLLMEILPESWTQSLVEAQNFIINSATYSDENVTFHQLIVVSSAVGEYLRYPLIILLISFALLTYFKNPILHFKKNYTMKSLLNQEQRNWPQITPVTKLNLVKQNIHKGPWAMSIQPLEFAKKHNLLIVESKPASANALKSKDILIATIQRDQARKIFAMQIGPYWQGIRSTPIHVKALFAVFAARIAGQRDEPNKLLEQISLSTATGRLNFSGVDKLLNKHQDHKLVKRIIQQHSFLLTIMASMLEEARKDGVIATADFLWLKPVDRKLWYMLNSVGRQTPFCEVAGPFAHWLAEKELDRRINLPLIEEAVNGLEAAMKDIIYKPDAEDE